MAEAYPTPTRRKFWPVVLVIGVLLALTTWDVLRDRHADPGKALRRAAFEGDDAAIRRILSEHPQVIESVKHSAATVTLREGLPRLGLPVEGEWPDWRTLEGMEAAQMTPLYIAVHQTNWSTARLLVESGADVNVRPPGHFPLAFMALFSGCDTNFLALLARRGAKLTNSDPELRYTLFHAAGYRPQPPEIHQFLLDSGVPIDSRASDGNTPLLYAVSWDQFELVHFLLRHGADWTIADRFGRSPLANAHRASRVLTKTNAPAITALLEAWTATNKPPAKVAP